jgi:hypothetical protein
MAVISVRRVDFGYFVRPGTGERASRVEPVLGYLVEHAEGQLPAVAPGVGCLLTRE